MGGLCGWAVLDRKVWDYKARTVGNRIGNRYGCHGAGGLLPATS